MAALDFVVPSVQVDESDVGPRPTPQMSLSKIGIVGTFVKGPLNTPTTIGDIDQLVKKFGGYSAGLTGYLTAFAALQQGADDLEIIRIAGTGAKAAAVTLNDATEKSSVVVSASSPGKWGEAVKISVSAGSLPTKFSLKVTCGNAVETFKDLSLDNLAISSDYITLLKATNANAVPKAKADVPLVGGDDGQAVNDVDYIGTLDSDTGKRTGLKALEPVQCGIVVCAQQSSSVVHAALLAFAEGCDIEEGLRVVILNSAPNLSADGAAAQTASLDSGRAIFAYPWVESDEYSGIWVAPDGYYAGVLASLNPCESPSNKKVVGITKCEHQYTKAEVRVLTSARISPITLVNNRGFRIRNGLTLSSDSAWQQACIRRQQDKMEMELWHSLQWAIFEPHGEKLWRNIADQVDAYFEVQKRLGFIRDYKPTLCDKNTNPPEMILNRILTVIARWLPLYPADYIILRFKREMSTDQQ